MSSLVDRPGISGAQNNTYQPVFYRLSNVKDKEDFDILISGGDVLVYDEILDQLRQLIKSRNPRQKLQPGDYDELISKHLNGEDIQHYGVWVYYPWSSRMVHILDEAEFIELRTSANRNKITTEERGLLESKKVGVIGLSVGQSVAMTLAMERICGELRLADFDALELNNLNRIRTGLHNLGMLKAYSVAREIAELDPFFKTVCFIEGITEGNIDDFFTEGGKLDVVIDECDSVDIKILCRVKAKELNVPVLMEASDRGTLDVERYDLEPERPIMHGWLEHLSLDFDVLRNLKNNDEKLPYMLPIAGLDTLSPRLKASVIEMSVTLTTWPQLATAVTLGGALTADTCRRIFLNQFTDSGRYFIDLEKLVPDTRPKVTYEPPAAPGELSREAIETIVSKIPADVSQPGIEITRDTLRFIVGKAILAPSLQNSQPWKWYYADGLLFLFHDVSRSQSSLDVSNIAAHLTLGAALENLELASFEKGIGTQISLLPIAEEKNLVAVIKFTESKNSALFAPEELYKHIDDRCTDRNMGTGAAIEEEVIDELKNAVASIGQAKLIVKNTPEDLRTMSNIAGPLERIKLLQPETNYDFFKGIKWEGDDKGGLHVDTLALSAPEIIGLKISRCQEVISLLRDWNGGQALEYTSRKSLATASAIGVIVVPGVSELSCIHAGRAMERMWLAATKNKISIQPIQSVISHLASYKSKLPVDFPENFKQEINNVISDFNSFIPDINGDDAVFLFSMGISGGSPVRSKKKDIKDVSIGI